MFIQKMFSQVSDFETNTGSMSSFVIFDVGSDLDFYTNTSLLRMPCELKKVPN